MPFKICSFYVFTILSLGLAHALPYQLTATQCWYSNPTKNQNNKFCTFWSIGRTQLRIWIYNAILRPFESKTVTDEWNNFSALFFRLNWSEKCHPFLTDCPWTCKPWHSSGTSVTSVQPTGCDISEYLHLRNTPVTCCNLRATYKIYGLDSRDFVTFS